jgi:NADPH-dependent curcumin reductase CurA
MSRKNRQVLLVSRPIGWPEESNFEVVERDIPEPGEGEALVENQYLSLDPYMRGRMNAAKSYAAYVELGDVMTGGTVGRIVASNNPKFAVGDMVMTGTGWQEYAVSDGKGWQKIDSNLAPPSYYLGILGMPGITAWVGLMDIGQPKPGETVVVSAASGAVGSVVGQLAKQKGCSAVGIAGGKAKCDYVKEELGFDACVDYRAGNLFGDIKEATPNGVDVYFENVGGEILDAVLRRVNPFARIPLCGMVSQYNETQPYGVRYLGVAVPMRVKLQGFIISDHMERWPAAIADLSQLVQEGKLKYRETVTEGLENAPKAFIGMLKGENFGKQLVKLRD